MDSIPISVRHAALEAANPWWRPPFEVVPNLRRRTARPFIGVLMEGLLAGTGLWLHGPRGVGKTLLLHHAIDMLLAQGLPPGNVCYLPADHPALANLDPEAIQVAWTQKAAAVQSAEVPRFLFVDEPFHAVDAWCQHVLASNDEPGGLVVLVASSVLDPPSESNLHTGQPVSRLYLPPLTFPEFLATRSDNPFGTDHSELTLWLDDERIQTLDRLFAEYLQSSGFSGGAASPFLGKAIAQILPAGPHRELLTVGSDRELREMMLVLAHVNGQKVSPDSLVQATGLAKNTARKYIAALETGNLVRVLHRISKWGGRMRRARTFRPFLVHPCLRQLLLGADQGEQAIARLAATGLLVQLPPSRGLVEHPWGDGLGLVHVGAQRKVSWAIEVGYRDENLDPEPLVGFCRIHHLKAAIYTTRTHFDRVRVNDVLVHYLPLAVQAYVLGYRLAWRQSLKVKALEPEPLSP